MAACRQTRWKTKKLSIKHRYTHDLTPLQGVAKAAFGERRRRALRTIT